MLASARAKCRLSCDNSDERKPMRVLLVINSLILAGAESLTKELALNFHGRGIEVAVYVLKPLAISFEGELRQAGVTIHTLAGAEIYSPRHIAALAARMEGMDVVHSVLFPASLWVAMAAGKLARKPALITSEGATHNRRRAFPGGRMLDRWIYKRYQAFACDSTAIRDSLSEWLPQVAPRASVIPNPVTLERFQQAAAAERRALVGDSPGPIVMFTARFESAKDHPTLLRAMALVPEAHLLLAGDGPLRSRMESLARELGLTERVHFLGTRADIPALLKAADVYVQSSNFEGFGIAALEAMAAGLPVIASDVPGLRELVGGAGLLFPRGDHAALGRHLQSLIDSPQLRAQIAENCRRRAQEFSLERTADAYLALYDSLLKRA